MPNDERNLETMPDGALGLIPLESCKELGLKVDQYLVGWREKRQHQHQNDPAFKGYRRDSYIISTAVPRFGTGEAKGVIKESVRGYDLYLMVDVTNYSLTYSVCGYENHMSPDDHYAGFEAYHCCCRRKSTDVLPLSCRSYMKAVSTNAPAVNP